ncbi:MAG: hypothetical protein ACLURV_14285 [Gallintestinimicrobium sp.]
MIADLSEALRDGIKVLHDGMRCLRRSSDDRQADGASGAEFVDGPNLLWLRRDWMDELGLEARMMEEAVEIVRAFVAGSRK